MPKKSDPDKPSSRSSLFSFDTLIKRMLQKETQDYIKKKKELDHSTELIQKKIQAIKKQNVYFHLFLLPFYPLLPILVLFLYLLAFLLPNKSAFIYHRFLQYSHRVVLLMLGIHVSVINRNSTLPKQVLFVTTEDIPNSKIMHAHLPYDFRAVVRYSLFDEHKTYFMGHLMKKALYLPINNTQLADLYHDVKRLVQFTKMGHSLGIAIDQKTAYQSPAYLLKRITLPIVPVKITLDKPTELSHAFSPLKATMIIGKPLHLRLTDIPSENLAEKLHHIMISEIHKLS